MHNEDAVQAAKQNWQFSLRTMLIGFGFAALSLAPLAYWGWQGAAGSAVMLGISLAAMLAMCRRITLVELLVILAATGIAVAALLPAVHSRPRLGTNCIHNMRQLALAMHLYHDQHGHFPPAYIADAEGRPMHSWRVLLLPYLDQKSKYNAYRWDEPWNGPNNSKLADCPDIFHCPSDPSAAGSPMTSYVVVTGPRTAFPGDKTTKFDDFQDGLSKSILIVEVAHSGIHWMEPRDLNVQQMAATINAKAGQGISSAHALGAVFAFADNHVAFLGETLSPEQLQAMLTIAGGERIEGDSK